MDYGIGAGKGSQILQPAIILNKCPIGTVVFLTRADYRNSKIVPLATFTVESDFLIELFQNLQTHHTTDLIYFRETEDALKFSNAINEGLKIDQSGRPEFPPHITLTRCSPGCLIVFTKHEHLNREIVFLTYYITRFDFIGELSEHLNDYPETDYIYFVARADIQNFRTYVQVIEKDENGRSILRTYPR